MSLIKPDVGTRPGPDWAQDLNDSLDLLDEHDHTSTNGVKVPSAGLNINDDLDLQNNDLINTRSSRYQANTVALAGADDLRIVYSLNGELMYRDALGNQVQITTGGSVNAGAGAISGLVSPASASFSSVTDTFSWFYDSAKLAQMAHGDIQLFPYDGATAFGSAITIKAPTALASPYSLTLPLALGAASLPLTVSSAGVMSVAGAGSASVPTYNFSTDTDSGVYSVSGNQVGISTAGTRRVLVDTDFFQSDNVIYSVGGTAAAPGYGFTIDTDTGMYLVSNSQLGFTASGTLRLLVDTDFIQPTVPVQGADGSVSLPTYGFSADTNTGVYRAGAGTLDIAVDGIRSASVFNDGSVAGIRAGTSGTAAIPSIGFQGDDDTGFYRPTTNQVGIATAGTLRLLADTDFVQATVPYRAIDGTVGTPSYSFTGDTDTGLYRSASNSLSITLGGSEAISFSTTAVDANVPYYAANGSEGAPTYAFGTDTDTGMYRFNTDSIGFAAGGTAQAVVNTTGVSLDAGGTFFRAKVFSGSLNTATSVTLTAPAGTFPAGATGFYVLGSSGGIVSTDTAAGTVYFDGGGALEVLRLTNVSGSSITYRVVGFFTA
jgi:hypothetical protein